MKNANLETLLKELLQLGFTRKGQPSQKKGIIIPWDQQFDISSWTGWETHPNISESSLMDGGKIHRITVRFTFSTKSHKTEALVLKLERNMPVGKWREPPPAYEIFAGCYWLPTEVRFCSSPATTNKVISLDPVKK